jgi:aminoglycoside phosphotransferase
VGRLRHGYTNATRRRSDGLIEKRYEGPGSSERCEREISCLRHLEGLLPVPSIAMADPRVPMLVMQRVAGVQGQDLIEHGRASHVLGLLGSALAMLQRLPTSVIPGLPGEGSVVVHGDFGPQNVLVDDQRISGLLDWEFARVGEPVDDLAWAEWIVRMHHPDQIGALPALVESSGLRLGWRDRQEAMVRRCEELLQMSERSHSTAATELWTARLRATERWCE